MTQVTVPLEPKRHTVNSGSADSTKSDDESTDDESDDAESDDESSDGEDNARNPSQPGGSARPAPKFRGKGFAFVQFACREDAAHAMQGLNGKKIFKRKIAVDWALTKSDYTHMAAEGSADEEEAEHHADAEPSNAGPVDMFNTQALQAAAADTGSEDDAPVVPEKSAEQRKLELARTLFVRNLPFDASEAELQAKFAQFGNIKFAKLVGSVCVRHSWCMVFMLLSAQVMDRETGKPKGTGFVMVRMHVCPCHGGHSSPSIACEQFFRPEDCKAALDGTTGAAGSTATVSLHGRRLIVSLAVDRSTAGALKSGADARRFDRRHLYLAQEGVIAGGNMPASDRTKRDKAAAEKRTKLRSPMFFVSPTKLSVRNLSRTVNDKSLRSLFRKVRVCALKDPQGTDCSHAHVLQAAIMGVDTNMVDLSEGDPTLRAETVQSADPLTAVPPCKVLKAKVCTRTVCTRSCALMIVAVCRSCMIVNRLWEIPSQRDLDSWSSPRICMFVGKQTGAVPGACCAH